MILGHESSGEVVRIGKSVTTLSVGDRVAIEPGVSCRHCSYCKSGKYNLCREMSFCATPPVDGTLRNFYNHPADFCFKLPPTLSFEEGAMIEPLAVAVHSCIRAGLKPGDKVLVCGAGPIGIMCLLAAKAMGADQVLLTDINEKRLSNALEFGADLVHLITPSSKPAENAASVLEKFVTPPQITLECSGAPSSLQLSIFATAPGGSIATIGRGVKEMTLPIVEAATKEIDIKGIFRYANCYPIALSMLSSGKIALANLVSHRFPLSETVQAFETALKGDATKVIIYNK